MFFAQSVATDGRHGHGLELENVRRNFKVFLILFRLKTKSYRAFREAGPWLWPGMNISVFLFSEKKKKKKNLLAKTYKL